MMLVCWYRYDLHRPLPNNHNHIHYNTPHCGPPQFVPHPNNQKEEEERHTMEYEYDGNYKKSHHQADDDDDDEEDDEVAAAADRVTATSYGALDTSQVSNACWLIRIPPALHQLLLLQQQQQTTGKSSSSSSTEEIGELIFTKGGMKPDGVTMVPPSLTIHFAEELVVPPQPEPSTTNTNSTTSSSSNSLNPSTTPLHYSLQAMTKKIPVMHPFVRHSTTGSCQLLGTVSRTANCQVANYKENQQYRAQLKHRLVTTNLLGQERFVKPVDVTESILTQQRQTTTTTTKTSVPGSNNKNNSFGAAVWQFGQHHQEYQQQQEMLYNNNNSQQQQSQGGPPNNKRARQFAPGQALRSVLFELFEQQPYWTIKELRQAAVAGGCDAANHNNNKRAEAEIRDILRSDIGEYHRSGDFKNKWQLRKEFQQQKKP